jgi:hypothetical protein
MDAWMRMTARLLDPEHRIHPVCAAAAAAFGFVFIHPFVDGNGRIHRFLVHSLLSKMNFTPRGVLFPVSAAMLRDISSYDRALEAFSASIHPFIQYQMDAEQRLTVLNETADLYRYFDATTQTEYLFECIEDTIRTDLKREIDFLKFFDAAVKSVLSIVDMPNQRASLLVRLIHQNNGKLSKNRRELFSELTDEEVGRIESGVNDAAKLNERSADDQNT